MVRLAVVAYLDAEEAAATLPTHRVAEGGESSGTPSSAVHRDAPYTDDGTLRDGTADG